MFRETRNPAHEHNADTAESYCIQTIEVRKYLPPWLKNLGTSVNLFTGMPVRSRGAFNQAKIQAMNACCQVSLASRPGC